jgi:hypothetical protein
MVLGVDGHLHIVADDAGATPARRHRATIRIGERDLLIGRGEHLLLVSRELRHLLLELYKLLFEPGCLRSQGLRGLLPVGGIELGQIPRDALFKLRAPPFHHA